ncbi:MAG: putative glycoside hydrolase [Clostridia bacterium]|nr:putative glycoside hydrolase [Clostridia bacterium]
MYNILMLNQNSNYKYDKNMFKNNRDRFATSKVVSSLRGLVFMSGAVAAVGLVLFIGTFIGRMNSKPHDEPMFVINPTTSETIASSQATMVEITAPPTTTLRQIEELLPYNELSENYWGPLPSLDGGAEINRREVHGLYLNAAVNLDTNIEIANNSEINAFVIDLKEANAIFFNTSNAMAHEIGYVSPKAYDLSMVCEKCHENNIWVIGRIVCFKDVNLANTYPDRAICDSNGDVLYFSNEGSEAFVNPYDSRNWDYLIDLAEEAVAMGVDEIQFDYVRFPTGSSTTGSAPYFGLEEEVPSRADAINRFLQTARLRIQDTYGVPVSADIFGIAVSSQLDGSILGQDWSVVGLTGVDSLCPMIYPSHYALGTMMNGHVFDYPDLEPYDIMYSALQLGSLYHNREGYSTVRPYCQAFTASYLGSGRYMNYGYDAINDQIKAIQDQGLNEFILWNPSAEYPEGLYGGNRG